MKRFLLMMAVIFSAALSVHAQRTITGTIVDQATNEPLIQASVVLLKTDSVQAASAVTNINGEFRLTAPRDGSYIVRVTYVGYKTIMKNITMSGKPVQDRKSVV